MIKSIWNDQKNSSKDQKLKNWRNWRIFFKVETWRKKAGWELLLGRKLKTYILRSKNIFNDQIIQNDQKTSSENQKKKREIGEFFLRLRHEEKKSRLRAFARTRAKNTSQWPPRSLRTDTSNSRFKPAGFDF